MNNQGLAAHETLELNEILNFKNVCLTKTSTMQALVTDTQLKTIMQQDVQQSKQHIQDIQGILSTAIQK